MTKSLAIAVHKQQLSSAQFVAELLFSWRHLLAGTADLGSYQRADVDRLAGVFRADFLRLPVFRFMNLDPVHTYKSSRRFFRWGQLLCSNCSKQNDCSLLTTKAKTLPAFGQYCSNAAKFLHRAGEQVPAA